MPLRSGSETAFVHEVGVGDFNGDGRTDFILSYFLYPLETRGTAVRLFTGNGAGGFTDATSQSFGGNAPTTVHARETIVADFNRDGRPDIFLADHGYDANPFPGAQNGLILSSGASGLTNATAQLPQVSDYSHSAEAADIDGDGDLDIFVGNGGGGQAITTPYFLINNGMGGFTRSEAGLPSALTAGAKPNHWSEAFLDVDGDGDKDLFLGSSLNSSAQLLLNDGRGTFTLSNVAMPAGAANADAVDIQSLDVNGDGRPDLVISYSVFGAGDPTRQIQLLVNNGQGGFVDETASRLPASIQGGAWSRRVHLADVNGDGLMDMVLSNGSSTPVYLADGLGHFIQLPNLLPGNAFDQITPADVNGDGRVDFIAWRGLFDGAEQLRIDLAVDAGTTQTGTAAGEGLLGDNDNETLSGGAGDDVIFGGRGTNYLRGDEGADYIVGGSGFDDINGNAGNDTCVSGGGDDWVVGGRDNDSLVGSAGQNLVYGNLGNDTCEGGDGNDIVRGGQDNDVLFGGAGDDYVSGDKGSDTVTGGAGADIFHTFGDAGIDRVLDFSLAQGDRVQLDPGTQYTVSQVGADTVIDMTGGGQMILVGVQMSSLTAGWIFGA
ncbi:FG-GAP-like repeat-containing protein [Phenylobacterium sp.]|uniref:FG-GAP-like repeat-containing protein n=1 Tax=Phenylobacterium sp. TaxID=1871053 RepID=UPI0025E6EAF1|nr:FG-GAP-like repeat-containing protein [Phenylobacterium sp.]